MKSARKSVRPSVNSKPAKLDVDDLIEDAAWIVATHDVEKPLQELIHDLESWLESLQFIADEHGDNIRLGQLVGSVIESERHYLKQRSLLS